MDVEEQVTEVLEEAKKNGLAIPIALGLLALGVGGGIAYIVYRRRNRGEVITLADRLNERPPRVIVDAEDLERVQTTFTHTLEPIEDDEEVPAVTVNETVLETVNIFAHAEDDTWDYEEEVSKRSPLEPYVIHRDEFISEEMAAENYIQESWTYFVGDETLVDQDQKPVYNHETVVGKLRFGHGSQDPNIVYVRNMTRNMEYEIMRDPGHYRVEILGLEMEEAQDAKAAQKQERQRRFPRQE